MKRFLFLLAFAATALTVYAVVVATKTNSFVNGAAPSFYTNIDTVSNTGVDTFGTASNPYRNSVGFSIEATKISGNPSQCYVQIWGSKWSTQGFTKGYTLLFSDTLLNVSTTQTFDHNIGPSGLGNQYRWYMITYNGVGTSSVQWQATYFMR